MKPSDENVSRILVFIVPRCTDAESKFPLVDLVNFTDDAVKKLLAASYRLQRLPHLLHG